LNVILALVDVPEKQRKLIIWNFMEELLENYQNATENNLPLIFNIKDFFSFGLLKDGFSEHDKLNVVKTYAKESGFIKFKDNKITLTKKGQSEAKKSRHSWDPKVEYN
jgi:hypothetical protein